MIASAILVACSIGIVVWHPLRTYSIPTGGMVPTVTPGSDVFVRSTRDCVVGDIIVFRYPLNPRDIYLKRVVAKSGDVVEIRDKRLFVNGSERVEPFVEHSDAVIYPKLDTLPEPYRSRDQFGPYRVPTDAFFVLGDNRDSSSDSRFWGAVPRASVIGRVIGAVSPGAGFYRPR